MRNRTELLSANVASNVAYIQRRMKMDRHDFSEAIGVGMYALDSYKEGRARPPVHVLIKLKEISGYTIDDMITTRLK